MEEKKDLVLETVNECIQKWLGKDAASIPDSDPIDSLDMDSLDLVETLVEIENELHINFNERDFSEFRTVGDIRNISRRKHVTTKGQNTTQATL